MFKHFKIIIDLIIIILKIFSDKMLKTVTRCITKYQWSCEQSIIYLQIYIFPLYLLHSISPPPPRGLEAGMEASVYLNRGQWALPDWNKWGCIERRRRGRRRKRRRRGRIDFIMTASSLSSETQGASSLASLDDDRALERLPFSR